MFYLNKRIERAETEFIIRNIVLVTGVGGEVESGGAIEAVKNQIRRLVTDRKCRKAFEDHGYGDPRETLLNAAINKDNGAAPGPSTWTVVAAYALRTESVAGSLGVPPEVAQQLVNSSNPATTVPELGLTVIRNTISTGNGLAYNVTHEYFHEIGVPGQYYIGSFEALAGFHDLYYLGEKYNEIIKACTGPR